MPRTQALSRTVDCQPGTRYTSPEVTVPTDSVTVSDSAAEGATGLRLSRNVGNTFVGKYAAIQLDNGIWWFSRIVTVSGRQITLAESVPPGRSVTAGASAGRGRLCKVEIDPLSVDLHIAGATVGIGLEKFLNGEWSHWMSCTFATGEGHVGNDPRTGRPILPPGVRAMAEPGRLVRAYLVLTGQSKRLGVVADLED